MIVYVYRVLINLVTELGGIGDQKQTKVRVEQFLHQSSEELPGEPARILR